MERYQLEFGGVGSFFKDGSKHRKGCKIGMRRVNRLIRQLQWSIHSELFLPQS